MKLLPCATPVAPKTFKPIKLHLEIESVEEAYAIHALFNCVPTIEFLVGKALFRPAGEAQMSIRDHIIRELELQGYASDDVRNRKFNELSALTK